MDRFARALKDDPAKMALKLAMFVGVPTLLTYAYNRQDPRTADIPTYEANNYTMLPSDNWVGITPEEASKLPKNWKKNVDGYDYINKGTMWKVPKAFEPGWFGTVIENTLDDFFQKNPDAFKSFVSTIMPWKKSEDVNNDYFNIKRDRWKDFGKYTKDTFVPPLSLHFSTMPREVMNNFSDWKGRPIVGKTIENPENRKTEYTHYTTETARALGKVLSNINPEWPTSSPETIEYFIRGWSGQLGALALQMSDKAIKGGENPVTGRWPGIRELVSGKEEKIEPASELADTPGLKGFVARLPNTGSRHITDFYENYEKSKASAAAIKRLGRSDQEAADSLRAESNVVKLDAAVKAMANQRRFIEQIMNEHHRKPQTWLGKVPMTAEEKRHMLNMTLLSMSQIAQHANANYFEQRMRKVQP